MGWSCKLQPRLIRIISISGVILSIGLIGFQRLLYTTNFNEQPGISFSVELVDYLSTRKDTQ